MSWALRRRLIILLILGAVVAAILIAVFSVTFYKAPSCTDNKQNQDETGIDCGGSCTYLCTALQEPPTVLFTTALTQNEGTVDVLALIENKNAAAAAKAVPYHVQVYGSDQLLLQEIEGTLDLPPGTTAVYLPTVISTRQQVATAFLTIEADAPRWYAMTRDPRIEPRVTGTRQSGSTAAPRIEATLTNPSGTALADVLVIAVVYDAAGDVTAASRTVLPAIPAQGSATALFTWNAAFKDSPARVQILPIIPLP